MEIERPGPFVFEPFLGGLQAVLFLHFVEDFVERENLVFGLVFLRLERHDVFRSGVCRAVYRGVSRRLDVLIDEIVDELRIVQLALCHAVKNLEVMPVFVFQVVDRSLEVRV
jgi:hypothetical protein